MDQRTERAKRLARDDRKPKSAADVRYQNVPHGSERCGLCSMFRKPNRCTAVLGDISPGGWCKLFARKRYQEGGEIEPYTMAQPPQPAGYATAKPYVQPYAEDLANRVAAPGRALQLKQPTEGQPWTEEDEFQRRMLQEGAPTWGAKQALAQVGTPTGFGGLGAGARLPPRVNPELAARYPEVGEPVLKTKPEGVPITGKTPEQAQALVDQGKAFWGKGQSAEAGVVQKARKVAQRDIEAGNYQPYFDVSKRADVDPANYPSYVNTEAMFPARQKPATVQTHTAIAQNPDAASRLEEAFLRGRQIPNSNNWYFMRQLEGEFIKEYGEQQGRQLFKDRFTDPMAATTGGADPTANLMMAHYGNWLRQQGKPVPEAGYELPYPVGGRFVGGNMAHYNKMLTQGAGVTPANPKRYNFSANFYGNPQAATLDEQMMSLFDPKMGVPPPGTYGFYQQALNSLAAKHGVSPREFQEVAWSGHKAMTDPNYTAAKPMIQHVNEAIERTSRITGASPAEVVRRALVRNEMPLYGLAGIPIAGAVADQREQAKRIARGP